MPAVFLRQYQFSMVDPLVLRPLERGQIPQAFPLVRSVLPDTSLSRWTDFARAHTLERVGRGIMAAHNQAGYITGIFTHEVRDELALGRTLSVANLMVADFPGRDKTADHLIDGMLSLSNMRGCAAIVASLDIAFFENLPTCAWALPRFIQAGFDPSGTSQCRKILSIPRVGAGFHQLNQQAESLPKDRPPRR